MRVLFEGGPYMRQYSTWFQILLWFWFPELQKAKFRDILLAKKKLFSNKDWKSLAKTCVGFLNISGKGGFGNTKFIAFEKLAWHYECFICACCNESMVGKGFIQDEGAIICPECARKKCWRKWRKKMKSSHEYKRALLIIKSTFCQKVIVHKDQKSPS